MEPWHGATVQLLAGVGCSPVTYASMEPWHGATVQRLIELLRVLPLGLQWSRGMEPRCNRSPVEFGAYLVASMEPWHGATVQL